MKFIKRYNQVFIFSRWSRKAWALFSAIGKQVAIGNIALKLGDIAYKLLQIVSGNISEIYQEIVSFYFQKVQTSAIFKTISEVFALNNSKISLPSIKLNNNYH